LATLFGTDMTSLAEPRGAGATPIQGVATPASQVTLPQGLMDIGVQAARDVAKQEQEKIKAATEQVKKSTLADYTRIRTTIASSNMPMSEKIARMNALDSQFLTTSAEMGITEDFKRVRDLMTSGGVTGEIDTQAKQDREWMESNTKFLRDKGVFIPEGASREYVNNLLQTQAAIETASRDFDTTRKRIEAARADTLFTQGQVDRQIKEKATETINQIGALSVESFQQQANEIVNQILAGGNEEQLVMDLNRLMAERETIINASGAQAPEQAGVWRNLFREIHSGAMEMVTSRGASGKRTIDRAINNAAISASVSNPDLVRIGALNPFLGDNTMSSVLAGNKIASEYILKMLMDGSENKGGTNLIGSRENKTAEEQSLAFVRNGIKTVQAGVGGQDAKDGYFRMTNNILAQLGAKSPGDLADTDLKEVADFMLSPEFVHFVKQGGIDPEAASTAKRVFRQVYGESLDGGVRRALEENLPVHGGGGVSSTDFYPEGASKYIDLVDVEFSDGKVRFVPKKNLTFKGQGNINVVNGLVNSKLRPVEQAINRSLKLATHLDGRTDYQKYWEENKDTFMPYMFSDPSAKIPNQVYSGVEYEYIGPPGGNTKDQNNWRPVNGGRTGSTE
jgi:hypothetical protein